MAGRRRSRTHGAEKWPRATERIMEKMMRATEHGVDDGLNMIEREVKRNLRRRTHPYGTPTNSPPGEPPALVTGHLRQSWRSYPAHRTGRYKVTGSGGPTAVQARIQERGGHTGAGHRTYLPPRPYVAPAVMAKRWEIREGFRRRWAAVILSTVAE